jgi:hypothetical protein
LSEGSEGCEGGRAGDRPWVECAAAPAPRFFTADIAAQPAALDYRPARTIGRDGARNSPPRGRRTASQADDSDEKGRRQGDGGTGGRRPRGSREPRSPGARRSRELDDQGGASGRRLSPEGDGGPNQPREHSHHSHHRHHHHHHHHRDRDHDQTHVVASARGDDGHRPGERELAAAASLEDDRHSPDRRGGTGKRERVAAARDDERHSGESERPRPQWPNEGDCRCRSRDRDREVHPNQDPASGRNGGGPGALRPPESRKNFEPTQLAGRRRSSNEVEIDGRRPKGCCGDREGPARAGGSPWTGLGRSARRLITAAQSSLSASRSWFETAGTGHELLTDDAKAPRSPVRKYERT